MSAMGFSGDEEPSILRIYTHISAFGDSNSFIVRIESVLVYKMLH